MYKIKNIELLNTAYLPKQLPKDMDFRKSIAFVGRSNVGKSSLMNVLFNRKMAKVSSTPGKTRSINFYLINDKDYFVDLPGYGYARRSQEEIRKWNTLMNAFFSEAEGLEMLFVLIDSRHSMIKADDIFFQWILEFHVPIAVVLTKTDKISSQKLDLSIQQTKALSQPYGDFNIFPVSCTKRKGLNELFKFIGDVLV
ncbi:MAG: ribosome biogenesis GTP-binding protein YihA/YsxC [Thermotogota bacterium]|nr:ribosome biogenesis GTP-binding protein YihA/YsxC [Thermotogota bacterium]